MANKTSYTNVEGLVPLKNNGNKFIGIKNNQLQAVSNENLLDSFNISQRIPLVLILVQILLLSHMVLFQVEMKLYYIQ